MSLQKNHDETYRLVKKRLGYYRYRSWFFTSGAMVSAVLLVLSLFPMVPIVLIAILGLKPSVWNVPLWFLCIGVFGVLFWIFQRSAKKTTEKRGVSLEEELYVRAYEALCFLKEYMDPSHPILGSKKKAIRRLQRIDYMLTSISLPYVSIIREEAVQMAKLRENLRYRIIPSLKKAGQSDPEVMEATYSAIEQLVDYLSKPVSVGLIALNANLASLPKIREKSIFEDLKSAIFRRSSLRHTATFSVFAIFSSLVYYVDINYFGATMNDAFELGLMFFIGITAIYVTYLGLTAPKEPRT